MSSSEILAESVRLVDAAAERGVALRLLGGVGIGLRTAATTVPRELAREYGDIDCVAPRKTGRVLNDVFERAGYAPEVHFNAVHGASRLLFKRDVDDRQIDVFLNDFEMCHRIDLSDRLSMPGPSLPVSDLLLLKLQIVELNPKDETDILALLLTQEISERDEPDAISMGYICGVCAADWGWFTTVHDNLERVARRCEDLLAGAADVELVRSRIGELIQAIEAAPKSLRWRMRDRVGRRRIWYELPEEVG